MAGDRLKSRGRSTSLNELPAMVSRLHSKPRYGRSRDPGRWRPPFYAPTPLGGAGVSNRDRRQPHQGTIAGRVGILRASERDARFQEPLERLSGRYADVEARARAGIRAVPPP